MGPQKWVKVGGFRESPPSLISKKEGLLCSTTASVSSSAGLNIENARGGCSGGWCSAPGWSQASMQMDGAGSCP